MIEKPFGRLDPGFLILKENKESNIYEDYRRPLNSIPLKNYFFLKSKQMDEAKNRHTGSRRKRRGSSITG